MHAQDIQLRPIQAMIDGNTSNFDKEATHTMLQHRIVSEEANAQFSQPALNKLLLVEEVLNPICSKLSYIAQHTHKTRHTFQESEEQTSTPDAYTGRASHHCVGRGGANCVCRVMGE
jgi:hypothetical protein